MAISLPGDLVKDVRQPVAGDSFGWEAVEPAAAKKRIVIHHSASPNNQDGFVIANFHVSERGWGGVGYHFVVTGDAYEGRPQFGLPAGAQVQYVGDLLTWRAHVKDMNPGSVGICLVGNFTNSVPSTAQLKAARKLIDFLLAPNNILPSLNYYSQVNFHNGLAGQSTECPGWQNPHFAEWFKYLQGGPEPSWFNPPAPAPVAPPPPAPEPTPEPTPAPVPEPGRGGSPELSEVKWPPEISVYVPDREDRVVKREGAVVVNGLTGQALEKTRANLKPGTVVNVAGYFTKAEVKYARSVYSASKDLWNGIDIQYFDDPPTGQTNAPEIPVKVVPPEEMTDAQKRDAFLGLPTETKVSLFNHIVEAIFSFIAKLPIFNKESSK